MKGLLVLAALLLVPSAAYYQKEYFVRGLAGQLEEELRAVLSEHAVEDAEAELDWLDATIGGRVETMAQREAVGAAVQALDGVRLTPMRNRVRVAGWVELARRGIEWEARGLLPEEFPLGVVNAEDGEWQAELERVAVADAPVGETEWERFVNAYFHEPGDRTARLQGGKLHLEGEATAEMRSGWEAEAAKLVGAENVADSLRLRSSIYQLAGYDPSTVPEETDLEGLREELGALTVAFAEGSAELADDEREKVASVAQVILKADERVRFVLGTAGGGAGGTLPRDRLAALVAVLAEYGVNESQLVKVVFDGSLDGEPAGKVEFLLK